MLPQEITGKRILISPLDWGMGHTTRCIPLIRRLIEKNQILFAGDQAQIDFIRREFPEIKTSFLEGYRVSLDSKKSSYIQVLRQISKIKKTIKTEQLFAEQTAAAEKIDLIISDNRYGLYSSGTKNILLTHQLNLQIPIGRNFVNAQLKKWIEKFDECWIPDNAERPVCGELVNADLKIPKLFIGFLSRFKEEEMLKEYKYLFIASGPEPERSRFAKKVSEYLREKRVYSATVGYKPAKPSLHYYNQVTTEELQYLINTSEKVIARAGYTTIMEMMALQKKCVLIPTPGQYEQEYLARTISDENITFVDEKRFFNDESIVKRV